MPGGDTCAPTGSAARCARSRQPPTSSIDCETGRPPVQTWRLRPGCGSALRTGSQVAHPPPVLADSEAERRLCRYLAETGRVARERGLDVRALETLERLHSRDRWR